MEAKSPIRRELGPSNQTGILSDDVIRCGTGEYEKLDSSADRAPSDDSTLWVLWIGLEGGVDGVGVEEEEAVRVPCVIVDAQVERVDT